MDKAKEGKGKGKVMLFLGCEIDVPVQQMSAIVRTESSGNPFAVGIVGHYLNRQPRNLNEAIDLINILKDGGYNYSVGLAQVNQINFATYGLSNDNMFDRCTNLSAGSKILRNCYEKYNDWPKAYSCYYSGNSITGFKHGYVAKVLNNISKPILPSTLFLSASTQPIVIKKRGGNDYVIEKSLSLRRLQSTLATLTKSSKVPTVATVTAYDKSMSLASRRLNSSLSN